MLISALVLAHCVLLYVLCCLGHTNKVEYRPSRSTAVELGVYCSGRGREGTGHTESWVQGQSSNGGLGRIAKPPKARYTIHVHVDLYTCTQAAADKRNFQAVWNIDEKIITPPAKKTFQIPAKAHRDRGRVCTCLHPWPRHWSIK